MAAQVGKSARTNKMQFFLDSCACYPHGIVVVSRKKATATTKFTSVKNCSQNSGCQKTQNHCRFTRILSPIVYFSVVLSIHRAHPGFFSPSFGRKVVASQVFFTFHEDWHIAICLMSFFFFFISAGLNQVYCHQQVSSLLFLPRRLYT